jgi:hypothetical protein
MMQPRIPRCWVHHQGNRIRGIAGVWSYTGVEAVEAVSSDLGFEVDEGTMAVKREVRTPAALG